MATGFTGHASCLSRNDAIQQEETEQTEARNHGWTQHGETLECSNLSELWAGDLSPSNGSARGNAPSRLVAALPGRQVGQTIKAVTRHRTPYTFSCSQLSP